ncbi:MAG TPA: O-methyltransferase [Anaerolineae bacterium]|nr:O-methyltransferase [Anaerolineae bacterium]
MTLFDYSSHLNDYLINMVPQREQEVLRMEEEARKSGFPIIGPVAGYFCYQITRMMAAKKIFELGSGFGYSTAWFARGIVENGGGIVHHVVWDELLSQQAQKHLSQLGFSDVVNYHIGEAVKTLGETPGTFDLIFLDIDKEGYPGSLPIIVEKLRRGGVLLVDNMLWGGRVFNEGDHSSSTKAIRLFTRMLVEDPAWLVNIVPVHDGLAVAYKVI